MPPTFTVPTCRHGHSMVAVEQRGQGVIAMLLYGGRGPERVFSRNVFFADLMVRCELFQCSTAVDDTAS